MANWTTYYQKHSTRQPRPQLVKAVDYCISRNNALDIGAGNLIESKFLIKHGFNNVVAIDKSPEIKQFLESNSKIDLIIQDFKEYSLPKKYFNLINAQFSLPFYGKENFNYFFDEIIESLQINGILVGQFFGNKDDWNTINSTLVFQTKKEAEDLLSKLKILDFSEEEKDACTVNGEIKHWHIFNFIAKRI